MQIGFWPPAPACLKLAQRIRAQLGVWSANTTARLCTEWLAAPEMLRPGDWLIVEAGINASKHRDAALRQGALVLEVSAVEAGVVKERQQKNDKNAALRSNASTLSNAVPLLDTSSALIDRAMTLSIPSASSVESVQRYAFLGTCTAQWQAALAAFLDCGFAAHDALTLAYAWRDIETNKIQIDTAVQVDIAVDATPGNFAIQKKEGSLSAGWPCDLQTYPYLPGQPSVSSPFASCPPSLGLYAVAPSFAWVERLLALGVQTLQLRIKKNTQQQISADTTKANTLEKQDILEIERAVHAARAYNARLFINDYWEYAIELNAYGVHLGQEDLANADLERIAAAGLRLGISTHGYYEMMRAYQLQPSYIALGAVFPTTTKRLPTAPQGLDRLAGYASLLGKHIPLVAIGGIDHTVLEAVLATGVGSAAVVRAITDASNPDEAVAQLQSFFKVARLAGFSQ